MLPDGSILIDGPTLIEEVNEQLGLALDDPDYDTIAGYFLGRLGRIPPCWGCGRDRRDAPAR